MKCEGHGVATAGDSQAHPPTRAQNFTGALAVAAKWCQRLALDRLAG